MSYRPWIGKHYVGGAYFGQRILIVGESHYGDDGPELTNYMVTRACCGEHDRFFTNIGFACVGREPYRADPAAFWHSVAFMNFLDESAGDGPTDKATRQAFDQSSETFLERIGAVGSKRLPNRIIVFSGRAWKSMPPFSAGPKDGIPFLEAEPEATLCGPYDIGRAHTAWAMCANHPGARRWNADRWRPLVATFLATPPSV